jgi:hypothetical protein
MENNLKNLAFEWMTAEPEKAQLASEYYCQTRDAFQAQVDRMVANLLKENTINGCLAIITL